MVTGQVESLDRKTHGGGRMDRQGVTWMRGAVWVLCAVFGLAGLAAGTAARPVYGSRQSLHGATGNAAEGCRNADVLQPVPAIGDAVRRPDPA